MSRPRGPAIGGEVRIGVIGGGIVGLATALKLQATLPGACVTVWEKEPGPGRHQSTHNSGVLHAGLYYKPGSLKARLAVRGIRQMIAFCRLHGIAHEVCGKLVVATSPEELPRLRELLDRGNRNGLLGLRWLEGREIRNVEPHASGIAAVAVPEEGIVDYRAVIAAMCGEIARNGGRLRFSSEVCSLRRHRNVWEVAAPPSMDTCDFLVNCSGLHCDRIAAMAKEPRHARIIPFRGEYYAVRRDREGLVRNLIYPVPNPTYPFLGVHFSRLVKGGVEAGPNAVIALSREGYRRGDFRLRDASDTLTFPGLWRFALRHGSMCAAELARSWSKRLFCRSLQRLVPEIREQDLEPGGAGVRAQAMTPAGQLIQDFELVERDDAIHVLNAPSPGATASLAIGEYIASRAVHILAARAPHPTTG